MSDFGDGVNDSFGGLGLQLTFLDTYAVGKLSSFGISSFMFLFLFQAAAWPFFVSLYSSGRFEAARQD